MKVMTIIKPHAIDGQVRKVGDDRELQIENVWNQNNLVRIKFEGINVEVTKRDLLKAIENATGNEFY